MSLRLTTAEHKVALFDSVTDWAFGPVFSTEDAAEHFLRWAADQGVENGDVRALRNSELAALWDRYTSAHPDRER